MTAAEVHLSSEDGIAVLTLDDPGSRNGLSPAMRELLMDRYAQVCQEDSVRAIVITGEGPHFCGGSDVGAMVGQALQERADRLAAFQSFIRSWPEQPRPVLVAVEGVAAGGGVSMVLAADWAVAADDAVFVSGWLGVGLVPDAGALWWLTRAMGAKASFDWLHSTCRMTAAQAVSAGIVTRSCPTGQALTVAKERAREILGFGADVRAATKRLLRAGAEAQDLASYLADERAEQTARFASAEHQNLVARFLTRPN